MQLNLFQWLREGARQSVLLGVADAVEELGDPNDKPDYANRLRSIANPAIEESAASSTGPRKRLGRTLKDIDSGNGAATATASKAKSTRTTKSTK